jgi:hypothetical protein
MRMIDVVVQSNHSFDFVLFSLKGFFPSFSCLHINCGYVRFEN